MFYCRFFFHDTTPTVLHDIEIMAVNHEIMITLRVDLSVKRTDGCIKVLASCWVARLCLTYQTVRFTFYLLTVRHQRAGSDVPRVEAVIQDGNGRWLHALATQCFYVPTSRRSQHVCMLMTIIITALHGMQTRSCDEISVCLSVRPSVRLSVRKKNLSRFLYHAKDQSRRQQVQQIARKQNREKTWKRKLITT